MSSVSTVCRDSSSETSTSCNFSPGRIPMYSTWHPGAMVSARSNNLMLGILGTKTPPPLFQKNRDHAPPAAHHVPVPRAAETRIFRARVGVGLHKHFFRAQLGGAVQIDRIHSLVGAERQNTAHSLINGRINHVAPTHDIGLDRFERVVLACRHLLERRRMHHNRHTRQRALQPLHVPNVSNEIPQAGMIESRRSHLMLLQLIPAENDQPLRLIVAQHDLHKLLPERPRSTRDQYRFLRPIHHSCSLETSSAELRAKERGRRIRASL